MTLSAIGNVSVMCILIRQRLVNGCFSRISLLLLHLNIADMLVTFVMMPLEICWNITVSWTPGDFLCRLMSLLRIFGLCLSGFLLICISIDRYFAIVKPLRNSNAKRRVRKMVTIAWVCSAICSFPQVIIFHVESHPVYTWYKQCVTFNSFSRIEYEMAYNMFGLTFLYGVPLTAIAICYSCILYKIFGISAWKGNENLRRSNMSSLSRAKIRTVKMTVTIVATFCLCWTPYNVMSPWYWFDKPSALKVDQKIQKCLFLFPCTNSCVNPIIYGYFHFRPANSSVLTAEGSVCNNHNIDCFVNQNLKVGRTYYSLARQGAVNAEVTGRIIYRDTQSCKNYPVVAV